MAAGRSQAGPARVRCRRAAHLQHRILLRLQGSETRDFWRIPGDKPYAVCLCWGLSIPLIKYPTTRIQVVCSKSTVNAVLYWVRDAILIVARDGQFFLRTPRGAVVRLIEPGRSTG